MLEPSPKLCVNNFLHLAQKVSFKFFANQGDWLYFPKKSC